jgi:hypothetical protein
MIILAIQPSGDANPGIWLLSGGLYVGIDTQATVDALEAAGIKAATVDLDFHQRVLAAVAAMVPATGAAPEASAIAADLAPILPAGPTAEQDAVATVGLIETDLGATATAASAKP